MKRHIACIAIVLLLGTSSWGQGVKEPFDTSKSRAELEIMKGILNTTLTFFSQNSEKRTARFRFSNMKAFYLSGQGAVFEIPTSGFRASGMSNFNFNFDFGPEFQQEIADMSEEIRLQSQELARNATLRAMERARSDAAGSGKNSPVAPAPPAVAAPPSPPAPPAVEVSGAKIKKSLEEAQARTKKLREDAAANQEKFLKSLSEAKIYLIEALANYGDGMTTVKPEEHINLVLTTDSYDEDQRTRADIISVRKSWISDYKAGRLTMDAFKQKVIQYNQ